MQPDPINLLKSIGLNIPLIGFYDAPDTQPFEPLVRPAQGKRCCIFAFFKSWIEGKTLLITKDNFSCAGAGLWLCGIETRSREDFIKFLVDDEGLKSSHDLINQWLNHEKTYRQEYPNILIGPLRNNQYENLKSITFYINPDQLGALMLGAQYNTAPSDPPPVITSFGSGCMQLVTLLGDLNVPKAIIGSMDIAIRKYLPPDIVAFTVTRPMFEQLCRLDERSFLYKPFWKRLKEVREQRESLA